MLFYRLSDKNKRELNFFILHVSQRVTKSPNRSVIEIFIACKRSLFGSLDVGFTFLVYWQTINKLYIAFEGIAGLALHCIASSHTSYSRLWLSHRSQQSKRHPISSEPNVSHYWSSETIVGLFVGVASSILFDVWVKVQSIVSLLINDNRRQSNGLNACR